MDNPDNVETLKVSQENDEQDSVVNDVDNSTTATTTTTSPPPPAATNTKETDDDQIEDDDEEGQTNDEDVTTQPPSEAVDTGEESQQQDEEEQNENPDETTEENNTAEDNDNTDKQQEQQQQNEDVSMDDESITQKSTDETPAEETTQSNLNENVDDEDVDNVEKENTEQMETDDNNDKTLNDSHNRENDHPTEEVDMENLGESADKDKSATEDPFDILKNTTTITPPTSAKKTNIRDGSQNGNNDDDDEDDDNGGGGGDGDDADGGGDANAGEGGAEDDNIDDHDDNDQTQENEPTDNDMDQTVGGDNETDQPIAENEPEQSADNENDKTTNEVTTNAEGVVVDDDLEKGKGVDEELSLLPDAEREITDADKERAVLAETSDKDETTVITDDEDEDVVETNNIPDSEETNKTTTEANDDTETIETQEPSKEIQEALLSKPNEFEIKEIQGDLAENNCVECNAQSRCCKYTLLHNGELAFLCEIDCVNAYRNSRTDDTYTLAIKKVSIVEVAETEQLCIECDETKQCSFRIRTLEKNLCNDQCVQKYIGKNIEKYLVKKKIYTIEEINETKDTFNCVQCSESKTCRFSYKKDSEPIYVCNEDCLNNLMQEQQDRFRIKRKSVRVRDLPKRAGVGSATISSEPEPAVAETPKMMARTDTEVEAARLDREASFIRRCAQCFSVVVIDERSLHWETMDFCNETCLGQYQNVVGAACTTCQNSVTLSSLGKYCVRFGYEIRQFCRSACLDEFKKGLKVCSYCQKDISKDSSGFLASILGQFKDFCSQGCMKKYDEMCNPKKKNSAGICSVCNNVDQIRVEILIDGRDHLFCSNPCFSAFKFVNNIMSDKCSMCSKYFERKSEDSYTIYSDKTALLYCSKVCMNIYIIMNRKIVPCQWCKVKKYNFDMIQKFSGNNTIMLCSLNCLTLCEVSMNAISMKKQKCDQCNALITPQYHLTMSDASIRNFCTYQCVMSFQSQFSRTPLTLDGEIPSENSPVPTGLPKRIKGGAAGVTAAVAAVGSGSTIQTRSPGSTSLTKVQKILNKQSKNKTTIMSSSSSKQTTSKVPIISNVTSLAGGISTRTRMKPGGGGGGGGSGGGLSAHTSLSFQPVVELEPLPPMTMLSKKSTSMASSSSNTYSNKKNSLSSSSRSAYTPAPPLAPIAPPPPPRIELKTQIVTVPPLPKRVSNVQTMCKPAMESKEVTCRPSTTSIACQTDSFLERKLVIPIPVPIFIPQPMHMYSLPTPTPIPIPLPIPVPIFIPTSRNSSQGIMKEIKKIQDKMPTDPFEAELLMMAEMVAGDKKKSESDSGSDDDADDDYAPETITDNSGLGEDMLQMALKMAQEYDEPAVDLESAMTANTITPSSHPHLQYDEVVDDATAIQHHHLLLMEQQRQAIQMQQAGGGGVGGGGGRGRKRGAPTAQRNNNNNNNRQVVGNVGAPTGGVLMPNKRQRRQEQQILIPQPEPPREPIEKADANMCLKFTFGVNAWKQWVMTKNADLEKSSIRRKPFKSELLQLTADELNYSLCLFVKEVRKPNGSEYAPDTIYYLVLGIQQYLYENGRIDNIFTDPYYEKFTDCLDDVAKKFSVLYNDSQYIVTRVEEEHLWECKQLGAHSPHVLLSTLMFFNTKHFNLTTVEEHMQLSFSHIMKHWKRNPNQVGAAKLPGSRNVLLRFYPPQSSLENNSRKKKVYEQQENEENPLRCPVKLYEFYLSKCPESVKTRNDVFYLQPERSCVPDSPVWYSTQALGKESLSKMLHRVKMVKEINIALLTS